MLNSRQLAAMDAAAAHFHRLASENVMGWGIGKKVVDGTPVDAVHVYVRKFPDSTIPEHFGELPTEVIKVGEIIASQNPEVGEITDQDPQECYRPVPGGVSGGHPNVRAGTLGCLVEKGGNHYILGNNHVLANWNRAKRGHPVIQPSTNDGGRHQTHQIATLEPYTEIIFSDRENPDRAIVNYIDAAIALVGKYDQTVAVPNILGTTALPRSTTTPAFIGQTVRKCGRSTRHTVGVVSSTPTNVWGKYGKRWAWFENQIAIESVNAEPFATDGDSGALIMDAKTGKPTALLFSVSEESGLTYANPIDRVLKEYRVTIVGAQGVDA